LTAAASQLMKAPLYIDDSAGLTINQVRARARRMKQQYKIRLLVIDYMQLMRAPSRRAESSRQVEVADISAGVKALAKELKDSDHRSEPAEPATGISGTRGNRDWLIFASRGRLNRTRTWWVCWSGRRFTRTKGRSSGEGQSQFWSLPSSATARPAT
jgi:hypothetical protein